MDSKLTKSKILLITGAPASGKDYITEELQKVNNNFVYFKKHRGVNELSKVSKIDSYKYHNISINLFKRMIADNDFIQYHMRYQRYYGISKTQMMNLINDKKVPIIHTGKFENVVELEKKLNLPTFRLLLWAPIEELKKRLLIRHNGNSRGIMRRLKAIKEELRELKRINLYNSFDLAVCNNKSAHQVVNEILKNNNKEKGLLELNEYLNRLNLEDNDIFSQIF